MSRSSETLQEWIERIARKKMGFSKKAWPQLPQIIVTSLERSWRLGYTEEGAIDRFSRYFNRYEY